MGVLNKPRDQVPYRWGADGYPEHPDADPGCPVCKGHGILDDGNDYGAIFVPCVCTGEADTRTVQRVAKWNPQDRKSVV